MKAILEFQLPEEKQDHETALNGWRYQYKLDEVWNQVFRPAFKHGYADEELNKLSQSKTGQKLIEKLAELYHQVVNESED